jgi:hypothetical protein
MRRHLFLVPLVIAATASVLALALRPWPSDDLDAARVVASSQTAEEEVLAQLTEGKALHQKVVVYTRHGAAATVIRERATEWYLPERHVSELWLEAGPKGKIVRVSGWVKSDSGDLLQEITTAGTEVITRDVASGKEWRSSLAGLSAPAAASRIAELRAALLEGMDTGKAVVSGHGRIGERNTVILDEETEPPDPIQGEGYSLPYIEDIRPVMLVQRTEVDEETFRFLRWSAIAVDSQAVEYVVEQSDRVVFEIVDSSEVPVAP